VLVLALVIGDNPDTPASPANAYHNKCIHFSCFTHNNYYSVFNPNPHCLGIYKAFFVKMKISLGWLKQYNFKNKKCLAKNLNKLFCLRGFR
jgi:hypothetical protein